MPAYSEFMPPPRLGRTPLGEADRLLFSDDDPYGWRIPEIEEEYEIAPGLENIASQVIGKIVRMAAKEADHPLGGRMGLNLVANPYWPPELAAKAGKLPNERFVVLLPLALSKTQDDMGRVRWTLFGNSEQGPERAFWKGFNSAPGREIPEEKALRFFFNLLSMVYDEPAADTAGLFKIGFRILPTEDDHRFPFWNGCPLPSWAGKFIIDGAGDTDARYLLTFRPFSRLPRRLKERYLKGRLVLLPFPGSLVFWGMPTYLKLQEEHPLAIQIPLLRAVSRHEGPFGIRVPQTGWLKEHRPGQELSKISLRLVLDSYSRTNRFKRVHRYEDALAEDPRVDKVVKVLFGTSLETMGLYDKPMARNSQLWGKDFELILDGPNANRGELRRAEKRLVSGGVFGYRFIFPAMRVGIHEVYWHRPLAAFRSRRTGKAELIPDSPPGYMTAYDADSPDLARPVELFPRPMRRDLCISALRNVRGEHDHYVHQTSLNLVTLLDILQLSGFERLPRSFVHAALRIPKHETLHKWLASLPERFNGRRIGREIWSEIEDRLDPPVRERDLPGPVTFDSTATRTFEEAWWNDIAGLSHGRFPNTDNADCVKDRATTRRLLHHHRDLERLGDYLLERHRGAITAEGMTGRALCGELPFKWQTDFDFPDFGGWKANRESRGRERNLLVVIPGRDRSRAVVMADHYDTAYMEDVYEKSRGGSGARLAALGADDNHSATATLLQAAPIFLRLSREGRLRHDVWLLHLTGEEFPADCMGARNFCRTLVEGRLGMHTSDRRVDLSKVSVRGVFVLDMIAHNRESDLDVFQISPGRSHESLGLAYQAHLANVLWNLHAKRWNRAAGRRGRGRGRRSADGVAIPEIAIHPHLKGEVRTWDDPQSSLYNTDGQIFSDVGIPIVLFMENYDINRTGYHDTMDTMKNIDLDFGSALAGIAIETVARTAMSD